ncbi:nucleolar protein 4-like isoform X2 [Rhopilema esculentum]|uniref:nucleolar protein 4-like isoform X2 n=1 Tax=Rhopilema esculentum TaxID=499914 RepID=UPI0031DDE3F8
MDVDFSGNDPDPVCFQQWLSATFLGNNRTKTITVQKYDRICRYLLGDSSNTNAKFRYWVKSKKFNLQMAADGASFGHTYKGYQLLIKDSQKSYTGKRSKRSKKHESRLQDLLCFSKKLFDSTKVAVVEDFYDIIKLVHVTRYKQHLGQKQTYKIISGIFSFLPREVVTHFLVNCAVCQPRMEKFGNGSKASKSRIFRDSQLEIERETEDSCTDNEKEAIDYHEETKSLMSSEPSDKGEDAENGANFTTAISPGLMTGPNKALCSFGAAGSVEETGSIAGSCSFEMADSGVVLLDEEDAWDNKTDSPNSIEDENQKNSFLVKEEDKPAETVTSVPPFERNKNSFPSKVASKPTALKKERMKPSGSGRRLSYSTETDERLLNWVKKFQENRVNVTREMLQKQALLLIQPECPEFKASSGWVEKFLVRHGITLPGTCRSINNAIAEKNNKLLDDQTTNGTTANLEPVIREPPNLNEIMNNVNASSPAAKDDDDDNDDDDDDDLEENDLEGKKTTSSSEINPERLKAFNMFVRLFVDENLDRLVPISKQPKEKINAIIVSCQRQFPEFSDRARKRIRTYLKSCRRSSRLKEPTKRTAESMSTNSGHIPTNQLGEVNNILSQACFNESQEVSKRGKYDLDDSVISKSSERQSLQNHVSHPHLHDRHGQKHLPFSSTSRTPPVKLSSSEISAVRQLITGYRESAAFLYRSADELENLLRQSEQYYGQQQQQQQS